MRLINYGVPLGKANYINFELKILFFYSNEQNKQIRNAYLINSINSSSPIMGILSLLAFSSFAGPILSPATR